MYPVVYAASHWERHDHLEEASRAKCTLQVTLWGLNPFSAAFARLRCFIFCLKNFKKLRRGEKSEFSEDTDELLTHSEWALFLEAALESAPQFIIQLYAVSVQQEPVQIIQMISLPVSFLSLAWASTAADYELSKFDVPNLKHKLLLFVTHLFLLSSRLFAIAFFTVSYKWWIISVLLFHSIAIFTADTIWLCQRGDCDAAAVLRSAWLFCLHWLRDDWSIRTVHFDHFELDKENKKQLRITQLLPNALFIVENIAMILLFYFSEFSNTWYSLRITICVCLFSVLGSTIRVTHFRCLTSSNAVSPAISE